MKTTTRRFKALNGNKKNPRIVDKIAIYDEKGNQIDCCIIHEEDGREFYYPSNLNEKDGLFTNHPKDAIDYIRNDLGDALKVTNFLGMRLEHVVRFIDRSYGEELRQKTLEGWKDAKFGYAVLFQNLNSFSNGKLIMKNKTLMSYEDNESDILCFDKKSKALDFIKETKSIVEGYYKKYLLLKDDNKAKDKFFNEMENDIESGIFSIYWKLFSELEDKNKDYDLEVVQIVLPKE